MKSHEQGLITKECVATHINYLNFKTALYSSAIVVKVIEHFLAEIVTVKLKVGSLLKASLCIYPLTFKKVPHLSGSPFVPSITSP